MWTASMSMWLHLCPNVEVIKCVVVCALSGALLRETREPQLGRGWISFCNILLYSPGFKTVLCFNTNIEIESLFSLKKCQVFLL